MRRMRREEERAARGEEDRRPKGAFPLQSAGGRRGAERCARTVAASVARWRVGEKGVGRS